MSAALFDDLLARYAEPHRHYHDQRHLAEVMAVIDEHAAHAEDIEAVRLAAWFHDAIYDPRRDDNEEASARLAAERLLEIGVPQERIVEVVRLVGLTSTHDPVAGDHNGELLSDADLAVLGSDADRYADYAAGIRAEYAHLPEREFARGRARVLRSLLAMPQLYRIPAVRARSEKPARRNVEAELNRLARVNGQRERDAGRPRGGG